MMLRCGTHIPGVSQQQKPTSKSLNGGFERTLSDHSDTLKSSKTVLLVCLWITSKVLLLLRIWLGYASTIKLCILQLQAFCPMGSVQAATQLQISSCKDGMHWPYSCSRIWNVGGNFSSTLEGGQIANNLEFFGEVLGFFLVFCIFY